LALALAFLGRVVEHPGRELAERFDAATRKSNSQGKGLVPMTTNPSPNGRGRPVVQMDHLPKVHGETVAVDETQPRPVSRVAVERLLDHALVRVRAVDADGVD
jgi:hypothetical protein